MDLIARLKANNLKRQFSSSGADRDLTMLLGEAISALESMPAWIARSEQEAPKDGTEFLAWSDKGEDGRLEVGQYYFRHYFDYVPVGEGLYQKEEKNEGIAFTCNYFTHWMPLPASPIVEQEG